MLRQSFQVKQLGHSEALGLIRVSQGGPGAGAGQAPDQREEEGALHPLPVRALLLISQPFTHSFMLSKSTELLQE